MQESETELLSSTGIEDTRTKRNTDSKRSRRNNRRTNKKRNNKAKRNRKGKKKKGLKRQGGKKITGGRKRTRGQIRGGRQNIAFEGENCQFVDFGEIRSMGTGCEDGTKMVLKNK